jgi:selenocysteine lyase/cysteine desulfurase
VRWLTEPAALRASIGFFTDAADIERLAAEVASLSG